MRSGIQLVEVARYPSEAFFTALGHVGIFSNIGTTPAVEAIAGAGIKCGVIL